MRNGEPHIFQLNRSPGGVPKRPIAEVIVTADGLEDDWQSNRKHHGGPDRALCLFSLEVILRLQDEGHPIYPGSTGENVTLADLDWSVLRPGSRLLLGEEVEVEITGYAIPCTTIAGSFIGGKSTRIGHKKHPNDSRLYAKVLRGGQMAVSQPVRIVAPMAEDSSETA